jgi:hypothetical protein
MPASALAVPPSPQHAPSDRPPAERIAEFVRDVVARSALYAWPPTADASPNGTAPRLTRAGKILFQILQREESGPLVDLRAVEAELAAHRDLFSALATPAQAAGESESSPSDPASGEANMTAGQVEMSAGETKMAVDQTKMATAPANMAADETKMPDSMSPTVFARWLGVDRRSIRQHIVEIPPGPAPALPPGKIPARRIGHLLRILRRDFLGEPGAVPPQVIEVGGSTNGHGKEKATGSAGQGALHRQIADLRRRYAQRE